MVIILAILILFGVVFVALVASSTLTELAKIRAQREDRPLSDIQRAQIKNMIKAELEAQQVGKSES